MTPYDTYPITKIAAVQAAPVYFDRVATINKVRALTKEAKENSADLVVFSECFVPGFPTWVHVHAPMDQHELYRKFVASSIAIPSPEFYELQQIARDYSIYLSVGVSEKDPSQSIGVVWNTNLIFDRQGNLIARHRKLLPTWSEKLVWAFGDGSTLNVHETDIGRIGALICGENTNSISKYALISQGEQIHISTYPACFPTSRDTKGGQSYFDTLMVRACSMAYEGKVFVAVSSQALDEEGKKVVANGDESVAKLLENITYGGTFIIAPSGAFCSNIIRNNEEGIAYAECSISSEIHQKGIHDLSGSYQRNDVYHFEVNKSHIAPAYFTGENSSVPALDCFPYVPEENR